ncbi:hypothetical protein K504DRAFT_497260 [Pleomassaria siparia CBS 279.74]|uniref:Clr5 domain-containing protein n=1 Tax=Pleomassaria siparia CBS 279.74 TaxID=1314801 RepID=A0A6G1KR67_9PLEO|nr:hypothetical protein K504DRAFT_497260 [Pleomassaria siparia CBS 279.74]
MKLSKFQFRNAPKRNSSRIPDEKWNEYKDEIQRIVYLGGSTGRVQALRWIEEKGDPSFKPSEKQLRDRVKKWAHDGVTTQDARTKNEETKKTSTAKSDKAVIKDDPSLECGTTHAYESTGVLDSNVRLKEIEEALELGLVTTDPKCDSTTKTEAPYKYEVDKKYHLRPNLEDASTSPFGLARNSKNRHDYPHKPAGKKRKQHSDETASQSLATIEATIQLPPSNSFGIDTECVLSGDNRTSAYPYAIDFADDYAKTLPPLSQIRNPILDPRRMQVLLQKAGIACHLDLLARILHKDLVFQTSLSPLGFSSLEEVFLEHNVTKIKAFAELLFFASALEDAFALFLLVWMARRGRARCRAAKALIQCARSATEADDTLLVSHLLRSTLATMDQKEPQLVLLRSLLRLELTELCHQYGDLKARTRAFHEVEQICPSQASLLQTIRDCQQQIQSSSTRDTTSEEALNQAFQETRSTEHGAQPLPEHEQTSDEYTLRDALSAVNCLSYYQDHSVVTFAVRHLRETLNHATCLFLRPQWIASFQKWQERVNELWPNTSIPTEHAVFFELLDNWLAGPNYPPWHDLSLQKENFIIGMSNLETISTISVLVCEEDHIQGHVDTGFDSEISRRAKKLLDLPDSLLLMRFVWCSAKHSRSMAQKQRIPEASVDSYRSLVKQLFAKTCIDDMVGVSPHVTMAESLHSSSTLLSMRRHAEMVHLSARELISDHDMMIMEEDAVSSRSREPRDSRFLSEVPEAVHRRTSSESTVSIQSEEEIASDETGRVDEGQPESEQQHAGSSTFDAIVHSCTCTIWDSGVPIFHSELVCAIHGSQNSDDERFKIHQRDVAILNRKSHVTNISYECTDEESRDGG